MADYIAISDAELEPEAPLTSSKLVRLRDNIIAVAEGDDEAPRVKPQVFHVGHGTTTGVDGDTLSTGQWNGRTFNGTIINTITGASLNGSLIVLPIGSYDVEISAPATSDGALIVRHQSRLFNDTDSFEVLLGTSELAPLNGTTRSLIAGRVTILAPKQFQVQTRVSANCKGGVAANSGSGTEFYNRAKFTKVG